ncbi:hypothetical protein BGZ49_007297 [Haplosporangium sp. Z 27]|nr:hypothetical protein BGZ49_007297 [Haplosporangium sp. Z 27]
MGNVVEEVCITTITTTSTSNDSPSRYVSLDDIRDVFPNAQRFKLDGHPIQFLKYPDGNRILPLRIAFYPDKTLEVVLSTTVEHVHVDSPMSALNLPLTDSQTDVPASLVCLNESVAQLRIKKQIPTDLSMSEPTNMSLSRRTTTLNHSQLKALNAAIEFANRSGPPLSAEEMQDLIREHLAPPTDSDKNTQRLVHNVDLLIRDVGELKLQGNVVEQLVHKMLDMQQQTLDRLALIQSKTEAILTQNYELLEYTIPRLFIVLPETSTSWDPATMLRTKFRLHFICECGEHTKSSRSKIPHHLHLANHEGYVVNKPTEFFEKYGPFLMLMLEMIKLGTGIAGHVVPALASLKVVDAVDFAKSSVDSVTSKVIKGVDYSLKYLEETRGLIQKSSGVDVEGDTRVSLSSLGDYLAGVEGLEGVELRQLGLYLEANNSDNLLGNLYRMTTKDGHVKWVCRHHYRAGYQEANTQKLRDAVKLAGGVFDEQLGSIKITLRSSITAAEFYDAFNSAKFGVYDLDITFGWDCSTADLEVFENALKISSVSILRLDLERFQTNIASKLLSTRYEILVRIIELTNMKKIHIVLSKDFIKLSSLQHKRSPYLPKISFEMIPLKIGASNFRELVNSLKTNATLTTLNLGSRSFENRITRLSKAMWKGVTAYDLSAFIRDFERSGRNLIGNEGALALSEALKINATLITLNLGSNLIGYEGALALSEALKTNATLTTLGLKDNSIGNEGALTLSEALKTNATLITLDLRDNSIGYEGALALLEALKTNATLTTLDLSYNTIGDEGALALSEALKTNTTLTTLNLWHNSIGDEGALALSEALKTNATLTTLNLWHNSIGDEGALALSEALKTNATLTTLDLGYNTIGDEGALALSEALKTNTTLTTLNLWHNSIGDEGSLALSGVCKTNATLTIQT